MPETEQTPEILAAAMTVEVVTSPASSEKLRTLEVLREDFRSGKQLRWTFDRGSNKLRIWSTYIYGASQEATDPKSYRDGCYGEFDKRDGFQYYSNGMSEVEQEAVRQKLQQVFK